jgi:hypothetical protein
MKLAVLLDRLKAIISFEETDQNQLIQDLEQIVALDLSFPSSLDFDVTKSIDDLISLALKKDFIGFKKGLHELEDHLGAWWN